MPITILDYVKSVVATKTSTPPRTAWPAASTSSAAARAARPSSRCYNAYPSTSGYWRCADCIGDDGFATVADFTAHEAAIAACPSCGNTDIIGETRIATGERTEEYALECGDCGQVWQS